MFAFGISGVEITGRYHTKTRTESQIIVVYLIMSNQLKLFLYIVFVAGIFLLIQNNFHIFDISLTNGDQQSQEDESSDKADPVYETNSVDIIVDAQKKISVNVELAKTAEERKLGLSFRQYLGDYDGMLFIFDSDTSSPFWMKDMKIPLDIIFVDSNYFIVDIKEAQAPCTSTYCPNIYSSAPFRYVLEVNSGFVEKNGITKDGSLVLHIADLN